MISGRTVIGVNTGASEMSCTSSVGGGGGRSTTGLSAKVVSAIVMSWSMAVVAMTGVAGRAMAWGGGGISMSGGSSIMVNSSAA